MVRNSWIATLAVLVLAGAPATASASLKLAAGTSDEHLAVGRNGAALVTWREDGRLRRAVVQGTHVTHSARLGKGLAGRHVAPSVAFGIDEVVLPDGTHYALQRVHRLGEFGHLGPAELRFSRWHGPEPQLSLTGQWVDHGRLPRICGTATYHGQAFFGLRHTRSGRPLDALGRNVYIDVLRGRRWFRIMGVLTRPQGFALLIRSTAWRGSRYRALVPGPNIDGDLAPDVTANAAMPSRSARGTCPFATGTYANA